MMADDEQIGIIDLEENLSDIDKPPEVPPGVYTGEVQDVQTPTSGKGNMYFAIKIVIPPEQLPADVREFFEDGATLFWNRNIVPNGKDRRALFNLRKLLEAMGLDSNTTRVDPNEWMGRPVKVRVVHSKYQGEDRAEIRALEAAEAPRPAAPKVTGGRGAAPAAPKAARGRR